VCIFRCAGASPEIPEIFPEILDFPETPEKSPEYPDFVDKTVLSGVFQDSHIHPPLGDIKILSSSFDKAVVGQMKNCLVELLCLWEKSSHFQASPTCHAHIGSLPPSQISATRWREEAGRRSWARCKSPAAATAASPARVVEPWVGERGDVGILLRPMELACGPHTEIRLGARCRPAELELAAVLRPLRSAADLGPPRPAAELAPVCRSSGRRPRG
jgi:hypothetical protein